MQYALYLINQSRAQHGLPAVSLDTANGPCALRHAQDVWACAGGAFASFGPCSHNDFKKGDNCNCLAENQGISTADNDAGFAAIHAQMMAEGPPPAGSYNHYWVITNPSYTTVAIGEYVDSSGQLWVSEEWK
jgi:hypothetical protein